MTGRTKTGQFKKGVSGNLKGRPSKKKQAETLLKKLDVDEEFNGKDSQESLEKLLAFYNIKFDESSSPEEQVAYAKLIGDISNKLISFQKPRISSINPDDQKPDTFTVRFGEPEKIADDHPMKKVLDERAVRDDK